MQDQHKGMLKRLRDGLFDNLPEVQRFPVTKAEGHGAVWTEKAAAGDTQKISRAEALTPDAAGAKAEASSPIIFSGSAAPERTERQYIDAG
ncbi:MAG: hypothetical protein U0787_06610 [Polyangia bacterium]